MEPLTSSYFVDVLTTQYCQSFASSDIAKEITTRATSVLRYVELCATMQQGQTQQGQPPHRVALVRIKLTIGDGNDVGVGGVGGDQDGNTTLASEALDMILWLVLFCTGGECWGDDNPVCMPLLWFLRQVATILPRMDIDQRLAAEHLLACINSPPPTSLDNDTFLVYMDGYNQLCYCRGHTDVTTQRFGFELPDDQRESVVAFRDTVSRAIDYHYREVDTSLAGEATKRRVRRKAPEQLLHTRLAQSWHSWAKRFHGCSLFVPLAGPVVGSQLAPYIATRVCRWALQHATMLSGELSHNEVCLGKPLTWTGSCPLTGMKHSTEHRDTWQGVVRLREDATSRDMSNGFAFTYKPGGLDELGTIQTEEVCDFSAEMASFHTPKELRVVVGNLTVEAGCEQPFHFFVCVDSAVATVFECFLSRNTPQPPPPASLS